MTASTIRDAAIDALTTHTLPPIDAKVVTDDMLLTTGGLGLSSIQLLHAFVTLENRLGFQFDDSTVSRAKFVTVGDFVAFLEAISPTHRVAG